MTNFFHIDELSSERARRGKLYLEFLRLPAMSAGVYVLAAGASDPQKPHHEDELYYVVRGRARMQIGAREAAEHSPAEHSPEEHSPEEHSEVRAGSVIFVEAEREHRFYDITEELEVLVFFAPAEQE